MNKLASSSSLFADRGNPWLSPTEQDKEYPLRRSVFEEGTRPLSEHGKQMAKIRDELKENLGIEAKDFSPPRNSFTVDPDIDRYFFASRAKEKHEPGSEKRGRVSPSFNRRMKTLARQVNAAAWKRPEKIPEGKIIQLPKEQRLKETEFFSVYVQYRDGTETEEDKRSLRNAEIYAKRRIIREDVVVVEIWSYDSGEMIKRMEAAS